MDEILRVIQGFVRSRNGKEPQTYGSSAGSGPWLRRVRFGFFVNLGSFDLVRVFSECGFGSGSSSY